MKIEILQTAAQVNAKAAWHFIRRAAFDGVLTGVATGDTTKAVYALVAALYETAPFDTSKIRICALDDYAGIEGDHPASVRSCRCRSICAASSSSCPKPSPALRTRWRRPTKND